MLHATNELCAIARLSRAGTTASGKTESSELSEFSYTHSGSPDCNINPGYLSRMVPYDCSKVRRELIAAIWFAENRKSFWQAAFIRKHGIRVTRGQQHL